MKSRNQNGKLDFSMTSYPNWHSKVKCRSNTFTSYNDSALCSFKKAETPNNLAPSLSVKGSEGNHQINWNHFLASTPKTAPITKSARPARWDSRNRSSKHESWNSLIPNGHVPNKDSSHAVSNSNFVSQEQLLNEKIRSKDPKNNEKSHKKPRNLPVPLSHLQRPKYFGNKAKKTNENSPLVIEESEWNHFKWQKSWNRSDCIQIPSVLLQFSLAPQWK